MPLGTAEKMAKNAKVSIFFLGVLLFAAKGTKSSSSDSSYDDMFWSSGYVSTSWAEAQLLLLPRLREQITNLLQSTRFCGS